MKLLKRILIVILFLALSGFLFRGWLYRNLVTYKSVGQRITYLAKEERLVNYIEKSVADKKNAEALDIIKIGLSITSKKLKFTLSKNNNDPNKLINSEKANCIGYAAFLATTCNYLFKRYGIENTWIAEPQAGQLYLLGNNIHTYFNSPFFKDHDFVIIKNKKSDEIFAVDPSINDYLYIDFITYSY